MSIDITHLAAYEPRLRKPEHALEIIDRWLSELQFYIPIPTTINGTPHKIFLQSEIVSESIEPEETFIDDEELAELTEDDELLETTHFVAYIVVDANDVAVSYGQGAMIFTEHDFPTALEELDGHTGGFDVLWPAMDQLIEEDLVQGLYLIDHLFHPSYRNPKAISETLGAVSRVAHSLNRRGYRDSAETVGIVVEQGTSYFGACKRATNDWHICTEDKILFRIPVPESHQHQGQPLINYKNLVTWAPHKKKAELLKEIKKFNYTLESSPGWPVTINGKPHWITSKWDEYGYGFFQSLIVNEQLDAICVCNCIAMPDVFMEWEFTLAELSDMYGELAIFALFDRAIKTLESTPQKTPPLLLLDELHLHPGYRDKSSIKSTLRAILNSVHDGKRHSRVGVIISEDNTCRGTLLSIASTINIGCEDACLAIINVSENRKAPSK